MCLDHRHLLNISVCPLTLQATSLLSAQLLQQCLAANTRCMTDIFYKDPAILRHEISIAIATAAHQGEKQLIELTDKLCAVLQVSEIT